MSKVEAQNTNEEKGNDLNKKNENENDEKMEKKETGDQRDEEKDDVEMKEDGKDAGIEDDTKMIDTSYARENSL